MTCFAAEPVSSAVCASVVDQPLRLRPVLDGTFRANPSYELLSFDRLPAEQQELFFSMTAGPDFYGILKPRNGGKLPVKSACRDTALLFLSLQQPGRLPSFVTATNAPDTNQDVAQLVLDGILEIEYEQQWVCGAAAFEAVCETLQESGAVGEIAQLSRDALVYGQSLPTRDPNALAARLYSYGRIPATKFWKKVFPNEDAIRRCLGIEPGGDNGLRLRRHWKELPPDPENDGWIYWQRKEASVAHRTGLYKLYVSPHPASLAQGFDALIASAESAGAIAFKVGKNLAGVLRPDKMLAYFSRFEELEGAAQSILRALKGCRAHGVPFTAQIGQPLLSWGLDPPTDPDVPAWLSHQSWRLWVANRLAVALSTALENPHATIEPWKFAVERLALEGVDTRTWSPLRKAR